MKKTISLMILIVLMAAASSVLAYTNLSPAEVRDRLVFGDTLLLLDVRETSEYRNGHIAEPDGRLPLTPAGMPWNSGILAAEYARLPRNMDIIVTCGSGARSAAASAFLESCGFTRTYNMTGGFSSWPYEKRSGGFGDHSGGWVRAWRPDTVRSAHAPGSAEVGFPAGAIAGGDSVYVELHEASFSLDVPPGVPGSDMTTIFRVTALDRFGLSVFSGDSLALAVPASIRIVPVMIVGSGDASIMNHRMACYVPDEGWRDLEHEFVDWSFQRNETVLRKWIYVSGTWTDAVISRPPSVLQCIQAFPNPFRGSVRFTAPNCAQITVFDVMGRTVERLNSDRWVPGTADRAGIYFIHVENHGKAVTKRVIYLK